MQEHEAIFKSVFGNKWDDLPPILKKHYANRPFSRDSYIAIGKMDIEFNWLITLLAPFLNLFGTLVPIKGKDIETTVSFNSEIKSAAFKLDRVFKFSGRKPFIFKSKLLQIDNNTMIEVMKSNICWKHKFSYENDKVVLTHVGYYFQLFGKLIPMPIAWMLGKGHAEEWAISEHEFKMEMTIKHPIFGTIYTYRGQFKIEDAPNE